jgi:hypothetical protein
MLIFFISHSSAVFAQNMLPQCQGTNISTWNMCIGTATFGKQSEKYFGEWKNGKRNGQGTFTFTDGRKFFGEWKDGKRNGQGIMIYPGGTKYVGEFKDNAFHGQGTLTHFDGEKSVGEWNDGFRNGQGIDYYSDGSPKYVGEWKDGSRNGQGIYTFPDGTKYIGEFKHGVKHGHGTYTFPDGGKYVGEWKDDKYNGQGTRTSSNGAVLQAGRWVNGIFVDTTSSTSPNVASLRSAAKNDLVAQAFNYVSGFGEDPKDWGFDPLERNNGNCILKMRTNVVDLIVDLNKGNPDTIRIDSIFTDYDGRVLWYRTRVEGLAETVCSQYKCIFSRVQSAWALIYRECKGTRKAF